MSMRFMVRKRRQPPAIIIVALIDVLIVVLIFLMVTTTFKKPQPNLKLTLPESSQATKAGTSDNPPLVIYIEVNGSLRFGPQAMPITVDALKQALMTEAAKNPDLKVAVSSDTGAPVGKVVKVIDIAKEAKLKNPVSIFVKQAVQP